jgi:hypothetical protein
MTSGALGVTEFQLYLLKTMQPIRSLLDPALAALNCDKDKMLAGAEAVSRSIMPGKGGSAHTLKTILNDTLIEKSHGRESDTFLYLLPLWKEFAFRLELDDLPFMRRVEFIRYTASEEEIAPWKFLELDVEERFDEVREIDSWGTYNSYTVRDPGSGDQLFLRFSWGLLQEVTG